MAKSSIKKIKGPFEKYNLFEKMDIKDHCWDVDGVKVAGPGIFCMILIYFMIFQFLVSFFMIPQFREAGMTDGQIAFKYGMHLLYTFLAITFMYSMCKRCRGLEGLLLLILLNFIHGLLIILPYFAIVQKDIKELKAKNGKVVEGSCECHEYEPH